MFAQVLEDLNWGYEHLDRLSIHADRIELVLSDDNSRVCNGWQRKEAVKRFRKIEKKLEKLLLDCEPKYGSTIIRRLTRNPIGTKCGWYVDLEKLADDIIYKGIEQIKHDGENK